MCFGPVVSDGYGVCYNPMNDHINFAVSSFNTCKETNVVHLTHAIMDALLDMKTLLEQSPRAKLWSAQRRTGVSHCPEDSTVIVIIIKVLKVTGWCWHIAHAWNKTTKLQLAIFVLFLQIDVMHFKVELFNDFMSFILHEDWFTHFLKEQHSTSTVGSH